MVLGRTWVAEEDIDFGKTDLESTLAVVVVAVIIAAAVTVVTVIVGMLNVVGWVIVLSQPWDPLEDNLLAFEELSNHQ